MVDHELSLPSIVDQIVNEFSPARIIVFGSAARGDGGPDSDLDLLVIFDEMDKARHELVAQLMATVTAPVPYDVFVTDLAEFETKKNVNGTMAYWPAHEGIVVHERSVA